MATSNKSRNLFAALTCVGVVLLLFSLIFGLAVRAKIHSAILDKGKICGMDSDNFDGFSTNTGKDDPAKMKYYYGFNVTNVAEYIGQTAEAPVKLKLNVVGPYAMRQYDKMYNVTFTSKSQVTYKMFSRFVFEREKSCDHCDNTDYYTNLNPGLLKVMTGVGSELALGLTLSNFDLDYATLPQCTPENIAYSLSAACTPGGDDKKCCCSVVPGQATSCGTRAAKFYGLLSLYDGGFPIPGLASTATPLFIRKNVHEFAYGYPSAMLGLLGFQQVKDKPVQKMLLAKFTEAVMHVCNYQSEGIAPPVDKLPAPLKFLGLITCSPVSGSKYWADVHPGTSKQRCEVISNSTAGCVCLADTSRSTTVEKPCCTVAGLGCLAKVTGYISDNLFESEDESYLGYPVDNTTQNTGCGHFENDQDFSWSRYESLTTTPMWYQGTRAPYTMPSSLDVRLTMADPSKFSYSAPVLGDDGTRMRALGVKSGILSNQLSAGDPIPSRLVFVTQVYRAARAMLRGVEEFEGIRVARYMPNPYFLSNTSNPDPPGDITADTVGAATPYDGVQDGSFMYQFPAYISRPFFLFGDERLLSEAIEVSDNGKIVTASNLDPNLYDTYVLTEPASGLTISGHKRLMASFALYKCNSAQEVCDPTKDLSLANVLTRTVPGGKIVPQYYMDETSQATKKQIDDLKLVMTLNHSAGALLIAGPILGALMAGISAFFMFRISRQKRGSQINASLLRDHN